MLLLNQISFADETEKPPAVEPIEYIDIVQQLPNDPTNGRTVPAVPIGWGYAVFSPDSQTVATVSVAGGTDPKGEVILWSVSDPKPGVRFEQVGRIVTVSFSPDGKWLAIGPNTPQAGVSLVDVSSGEVKQTLPGPVARTNAVAWSHDGSELALASTSDRTIRIWSVKDKKFLKAIEPEASSFFSLGYGSSGQLLVAGVPTAERDALGIFDGHTGKTEKVLKGHKEMIEAVSFSADATTVASVGWDATVRVWDMDKGTETAAIKGHKKGIRSLAISADGKRMASSNDRELKLWDGEKKELLSDLGGDNTGAKFLTFSPDGLWLLSISRDGTAHLWDVEKKVEKSKLDRDIAVTVASTNDDGTTRTPAATINDVPEAEAIQSLAYSHDGKWIAIAREDGRISIRKSEDGSVAHEIEAFSDVASCVTFSPDSQRVAAGSFDKSAKVWNVATGELVTELLGHTNWIFSVAFSPDGSSLATASYDKTAKIWKVDDGSELATLEGHVAGVRSVVFTNDGQFLISGSADRTAIVWSVSDQRAVATLKGHASAIRAVACSPDGKTIATASEDATIKLWKTSDWTERTSISGTEGVMFWCVAYSPAGRTLAAGAFDGTVKLYDPESGKERKTLRGSTEAVTAVAFAPGAVEIIAGSVDKSLRRWKAETAAAAKPKTPEKPNEPKSEEGISEPSFVVLQTERAVSSLAFSKDGHRLAVGTGLYRSPGWLQLWDVASKEKLWQGDEFKYGIPAVAFSLDEKKLVFGNFADNFLRLIDATNGKQLKEIRGHRSKIAAVAFAPNGKTFASASLDRDVKLWDATTNKEVKTFVGHTDFVFSIVFSLDGKRLLSGSYDRTARVWDIESGKEVIQLKGQRGPIQQAIYSRDGSMIATAGADASAGGEGVVRIYDAATGDYILSLRGHRTKVESVAFAPNGKLIATSSSDKTVRFWSMTSGAELLKLTQDAVVRVIAFAPDGKYLAGGCDDKTVKLWDVKAIAGETTAVTQSQMKQR